MEEILRIADDVTIMRDGKWIETRPASELTTDEIIRLMVGRDLSHRFPPKENLAGDEVLRVEGLTASVQPSLQDVSFDLRKGEILGIAGLMGPSVQTLSSRSSACATYRLAASSCTAARSTMRRRIRP